MSTSSLPSPSSITPGHREKPLTSTHFGAPVSEVTETLCAQHQAVLAPSVILDSLANRLCLSWMDRVTRAVSPIMPASSPVCHHAYGVLVAAYYRLHSLNVCCMWGGGIHLASLSLPLLASPYGGFYHPHGTGDEIEAGAPG